jgi:hypothetical protein
MGRLSITLTIHFQQHFSTGSMKGKTFAKTGPDAQEPQPMASQGGRCGYIVNGPVKQTLRENMKVLSVIFELENGVFSALQFRYSAHIPPHFIRSERPGRERSSYEEEDRIIVE